MKRRYFFKTLITGASSAAAAPLLSSYKTGNSNFKQYAYGEVDSLKEAKNDEGLIAVRIAFSSDNPFNIDRLNGKIEIKNGRIVRSSAFHFEYDDDQYNPQTGQIDLLPNNVNTDVITIWLTETSNKTAVQIKDADQQINFTLEEILRNREAQGRLDDINWRANLLLYKEIGEIDPKDVGIAGVNDEFSFVVMADPQGGDPFENKDKLKTRMRIHNAYIEESVALVRKLNCNPEFTMVVGDITDDWGAEEDFKKMNEFLKKTATPVLFAIGNHETRLRSKFEPGYNMEAFSNFFAAQKELNGLEKLLYSFNLGKWHFVIWPDPLRKNFFETHPHYFDWLERDLEKYKNHPTMIFHHVPLHPVGITPLINYSESVTVKKELLKIFSKHGNIKYVFSGHVHIPVRASFKTAVSINGIKFINLPAAGYRPRAFGEPDFHGGPSQGIAIVEVKGEEANVTFKTVTEEEYAYPKTLQAFNTELYFLWFNQKWEIPASKQFVNGNFKEGHKGWGRRYIYQEDEDPSNRCEIREIGVNNSNSVYLFNRNRGYLTPGQDRWPQDMNQVFQALSINPGELPLISFDYKIDFDNSKMNELCGAYVWLEGFAKSTKHFNLMYSISKVWANIGGNQGLIHQVFPIQLEITDSLRNWNQVQLNPAHDFNRFSESRKYNDLNIDRILVTCGVWTANDGDEKPFGIYFCDFKAQTDSNAGSSINGKPVTEKPVELRWWRNKDVPNKNISGEHRYILDTPTRFSP